MKAHLTSVFLFFLISFLPLNAQNVNSIINPQVWWGAEDYPGTIEDALITIDPQGAYMEIGLYLTLSDDYHYNSAYDSLEIAIDFNLPKGAIVIDSWLWMLDDTTIVKADLYEIWKATQIYEDIVDRQKDPSILYQKENGNYQIRIYPS